MSRLSEALDRLKQGGMIVLVDDEDRENEGDLVMAAEFADAAAIAFMARKASGLICLTLEPEAVDRLGLPPMVSDNRTSRQTAFTVSIEAAEGVDTGISAFDRARTISAAVAPDAGAQDLVSPGHIFPLRARPGGVLEREGHTEASVDLMRLAGLRPAGVICEIMKDDGTMARMPDLEVFCRDHDLPLLTIAELVAHRRATELQVEEVASARLPSEHGGAFEVRAFRNRVDGVEHLAMIAGPLTGTPLVRVHSECLTGDALGSRRCDCGAQLQESLRQISESGNGCVLYLRGHEGRGLGLANKIRAYALQDEGLDTVQANHALGYADDLRDYSVAAQMLRAMAVERVNLLSNNPRKAAGLRASGITVSRELPLAIPANPHNAGYLDTKRDKLGHSLARAS
ncbi:bifunctional 3,4-dihydroxy-2-butanone-4-phosphate synthase/GTP cyclohydrolase II [Caulobacter henricii]|uniref:Riboflavin biosynthesis protein RibBA n=1 Tax=Caulobacter henricii TaxID=69395 RepID=A0A0P0NX74_9CAUL|nr:bifunctional 3,4-dihydroxy-2-butanone-4-phosphate synthase/GTP cyclohydrolase II [Caulobacter henricii]ALL12504.1 3,4-dihydroxy-2-butanone 4-phosphate synthase [Caulobacter henricii]